MTRGRFISVEGGEGVGKSSSLQSIAKLIRDWGFQLTVTREPGGTAVGERLRDLVLSTRGLCAESELLVMFAARAQHVREIIRPALMAGHWVVTDRYTDASFAYQGGGRGIACDVIAFLEEHLIGGLRPDVTFLLDAPVEVGLGRARQRGAMDRFESEREEFLQNVRQAYLDRAKQHPDRIIVIDAARDAASVHADMAAHLKGLLEHEARNHR